MSKYRDRLEIVMDMLSVIGDNGGARKTRIMYMANLSWELLVRYLNNLLESGIVRCAASDCYMLTSKGKRLLEKCSNYHEHNKTVKDQLNDVESERAVLEKMIFDVKEKDKK